jgi:hypothetical protein
MRKPYRYLAEEVQKRDCGIQNDFLCYKFHQRKLRSFVLLGLWACVKVGENWSLTLAWRAVGDLHS